MVETHRAEYSYYRADESRHEPVLPDSEELSLLEEHWDDDSSGNYLCITEDEFGIPQAHTFEHDPFPNVGTLPKHPATEGACYHRAREFKAYRNFLVSSNNAILPEGSGFSKFLDRITGDRITHIADTNENGVPDSGDTGYTRWGERVDDILLTSPITEYDEVEPVYGHEINNSPRKGSLDGDNLLILASQLLIPPDDGSVYDVRHFDADSGEALAVEVGKSSTDYIETQYDAAREMGAAISDNPVIAGAVTVGLIAATLHPYGRAAVTGLAYLGSIGGAMYMVYDRAMGIYNYAAGKAKDVIMGTHDFDALLWMAGATAFKGMTVTEAIQAPVRVLEAYNATMVGGLRVLMSRGGGGMGGYMYGGMKPALSYAGGGIALEAEVAVAATSMFPRGHALAGLFPAAMAMSAEGAVTIDAGNGGRKFIDIDNFPPKKKAFDDWSKSKSYDAEKKLSELLNKNAEYHMKNATDTRTVVEAEHVGERIPEAVKRMMEHSDSIADEAIGRLSKLEEKMEALETIYKYAPKEVRAMIDAGMETISRSIKSQSKPPSAESMAELAESQYQRFSRHFDEVIDVSEGAYRTSKKGEILPFLRDKLPSVEVDRLQIDLPKGFTADLNALKSAQKKGLWEKYLPEAIKFLQNGADTNGSTGASVRWSLKGHPNIGEVRFMGPGKRVYFSKKVGDGKIHILECGKKGSKKMQDADIVRAQDRFDELVSRFKASVPLYN